MVKIAILIPYFGSWPEWFGVFLETCKHNEKVDWIFFTDCPIPSNKPKNAIFRNADLADFEDIVLDKTKVKPNIEGAYKICDFRPAFGEIFEDYLEEYDFWGWGDIDVVYGNLENIFTKSNLKKYDVISVRRRRTAGPLTIFRNAKKTNKMYAKSPNYKKVFKGSAQYGFDEAGNWIRRGCFSITDVIKKYKKSLGIEVLFWDYAETDKKIKDKSKEMYWSEGEMYETEYGEEVYLYHFLDRKSEPEFVVPENIDVSNGFFIGRKGIREANPSYSVQRRPFLLAGKRVKDGLRWMRDRMEQNWG